MAGGHIALHDVSLHATHQASPALRTKRTDRP